MMTKSDADGQNTSRYRISKKKQTQPIYEMVPCYEEAVILGDSLAESILDFRCFENIMLWQSGTAASTVFRAICCLLFPCSPR